MEGEWSAQLVRRVVHEAALALVAPFERVERPAGYPVSAEACEEEGGGPSDREGEGEASTESSRSSSDAPATASFSSSNGVARTRTRPSMPSTESRS